MNIFGSFSNHLKEIQVQHRWFINYLLVYCSPISGYEMPQWNPYEMQKQV